MLINKNASLAEAFCFLTLMQIISDGDVHGCDHDDRALR